MKKIELENGFVEYKTPNIAEAMILLGDMGFSTKDLESMGSKDGEVKDTYFLGHLLNKLDRFIIKIDIKDANGPIENYDQLLNGGAYFASVLMVIATDVLSSINVDAKKKSPSKKR